MKNRKPMMNAIRRLVSFLLLVTILSSAARCQAVATDSLMARIFKTDELLPALTASALQFSPDVKKANNTVALWEENTRINKKSIFNAVSFLTSVNHGTLGDITVAGLNNGVGPVTNFQSSQTNRYNVGVNLQLPLTHIISRKNLIHTAEIQRDMAAAERDNISLFIKQEVIRMYQDLKLSFTLIKEASLSKQAAKASYTLAEKQFLQGQMDLQLYSQVQEIYSKSSIAYETYFNRYQTYYMQLEAYTGTTFSSLLSNVK